MRGLAVYLLTLIALTACTEKKPAHLPKNPFQQFNYVETQSVSILKNDPETGDRWDVRLRPAPGATEGDGTPLWEFTDTSVPWIDRLVDRSFLFHLLDTLSTLQVASEPQSGPPTAFGLSPPFFAIQWKTSSHPEQAELRLGQTNRSPEGRFALIKDENGHDQIVVIQGAVLQMLAQLQNLQQLRRQVLFTWDIDAIDGVRWKSGSVERRSDGWITPGKKGHRPIAVHQTEDWLQFLCHLRINHFIDDTSENSQLLTAIRSAPDHLITFEGRRKNKFEFRVKIQNGKLYGWVSTRPRAIFQLYLDTLKHILPPR